MTKYHLWATNELATIQAPLLTCEAVLSEAWFLLQRVSNGQETLVGILNQRMLEVSFHLNQEMERITELLIRYQSVPMSFADACLVRMAERYPDSPVFTLDSDFQIYRKNINQTVPLIFPAL